MAPRFLEKFVDPCLYMTFLLQMLPEFWEGFVPLSHTHTQCSSGLNFEFTENLFQSCLVLNPLHNLRLLLELFRV